MSTIRSILRTAKQKNKTIGTVESLTGGLLLASLTSISGASQVIKGGLVTYTNETKQRFLYGLGGKIKRYGAISEEVALAMAKIGRYRLNVDICIALTGNAGPQLSEGKPLGLVYLAVATPQTVTVTEHHLTGTRFEIRKQVVALALSALEDTLK